MPKELVVKRRRNKGNIDSDRTIPQSTVPIEKKSKVEVLEEYYNYDSMRLIPITQGSLERLMENGRKWAREEEDAIKLSQFTDLNGIPLRTWQRWREAHKVVDEGTRDILMILGNKRELGLLKRKFEPGSTIFMMPHYDEDWKDMCKWRASLKPKEEGGKGGETFVVIEKYPNSPLVPEKKDEE